LFLIYYVEICVLTTLHSQHSGSNVSGISELGPVGNSFGWQ